MNIKTIALITAALMGGGLLLANNTYADTPVTIPFEDVNMCNAVAFRVGSGKIAENNCSDETTPNIVMTDSNIESITDLSLSDNNISNISGIEYFTSLTNLDLQNNQITDLTPLKDLTSLTELHSGYNQISDLTPLKDLASLTELHLYSNQITDLTPLKDLTSLTVLELYNNQITDITHLEGLTNLIELRLGENQICDLASLANLTNLTTLRIGNNCFSDITPLFSLEKLEDNPFSGDGLISISSIIINDKSYNLPSLFLLLNDTLDAPSIEWLNTFQNEVREMKDAKVLKFEPQNAVMNEDGESITILDTTKPAVIDVAFYMGDEEETERFVLAQLTVTYEEPVEPVDPTDPTNDPAVPNTGENTQESSAAILTATLCILSGIVLAAIPMTRRYLRNRK